MFAKNCKVFSGCLSVLAALSVAQARGAFITVEGAANAPARTTSVVRISTPPALPNRLQSANHEMHLGRHHPKSKEEDKYTSGYQREHPEQIDVEPSAAQHSDTELLVNQYRHQASYQKIAQGMHGN